MKTYLLTLWMAMLSLSLFAQDTFSYIGDRSFTDPTELIGYDFKPGVLERKGGSPQDLNPGEYSFGISQANLFVAGDGIKGVYSINNINTTEYGYKLLLMNARDPTIQGHLKIVLNDYAQVDALIFKRSTKEEELIFYQNPTPKSVKAVEAEYFTNRWEMEIANQDSLWGKSIKPFFRIHTTQQGVQERLQMKDSTQIDFIQTVRIIDKGKKKKKKKKEGDAEERVIPSIEEALAMDDKQRKEAQIKVVERRLIKIRSIITYEDGAVEDKVEEYDIEKITQRENEMAPPGGERYQLEFKLEKGPPVYLYLTPKRTITSFETEDINYLMKGI